MNNYEKLKFDFQISGAISSTPEVYYYASQAPCLEMAAIDEAHRHVTQLLSFSGEDGVDSELHRHGGHFGHSDLVDLASGGAQHKAGVLPAFFLNGRYVQGGGRRSTESYIIIIYEDSEA